MTPNRVLALYGIWLGCCGYVAGNVLDALGVPWLVVPAAFGIVWLGHVWFHPRFAAYRRAWKP